MNNEFIGIAFALALGLSLLAQEQFLIGKVAGLVVLVMVAVYEWRRHFGTAQAEATREGDALPPSRRKS